MARALPAITILLGLTSAALGQLPIEPPTKAFKPIPYEQAPGDERGAVEQLLKHPHWTARVFALQRLERYRGQAVEKFIIQRLGDDDWHVRCTAMVAATRLGIAIPKDTFAEEREARVVRLALWLGVDVPEKTVADAVKWQLRQRNFEEMMLGVEIAAATKDKAHHKTAETKLHRFLARIKPAQYIIVAKRLEALVDVAVLPRDAPGWHKWARLNRKIPFKGPPQSPLTIKLRPVPWIATLDQEQFANLTNYLDELRIKKIETVVCMDATGSMGGSILACQQQVDRLILVLNDLSKSMRFGFVAYRDLTDGQKVIEMHKLTPHIDTIRSFMLQIEASGGGDFPESVTSALLAAAKTGWSRDAIKQIVFVADAPAHEKNARKIESIVKKYRARQTTVHAVVVRNNEQTRKSFASMTHASGGTTVTLNNSTILARTIMGFSFNPDLVPAFNDFFDLYVMFSF